MSFLFPGVVLSLVTLREKKRGKGGRQGRCLSFAGERTEGFACLCVWLLFNIIYEVARLSTLVYQPDGGGHAASNLMLSISFDYSRNVLSRSNYLAVYCSLFLGALW